MTAASQGGKDFDPVKRPKHYNMHPSGVEARFITGVMRHPNLANAMKYALRCRYSDRMIQDLGKAAQYVEFEIGQRQDDWDSEASAHNTRAIELVKFNHKYMPFSALVYNEPDQEFADLYVALWNADLDPTGIAPLSTVYATLVSMRSRLANAPCEAQEEEPEEEPEATEEVNYPHGEPLAGGTVNPDPNLRAHKVGTLDGTYEFTDGATVYTRIVDTVGNIIATMKAMEWPDLSVGWAIAIYKNGERAPEYAKIMGALYHHAEFNAPPDLPYGNVRLFIKGKFEDNPQDYTPGEIVDIRIPSYLLTENAPCWTGTFSYLNDLMEMGSIPNWVDLEIQTQAKDGVLNYRKIRNVTSTIDGFITIVWGEHNRTTKITPDSRIRVRKISFGNEELLLNV